MAGVEVVEESGGGRTVFVESRKYDGRLHRSWTARLVRVEGALVVVEGTFDEEVAHPNLGVIEPGTISREFYWTDRWYSVFRFQRPGGRLRNYYCNVNEPARFDGETLRFVDLDIDLLVAPDMTYTILDEDEFAAHAARFKYSTETRRRARAAVDELIDLVTRRLFPFGAGASL
jgi:protein associated with RNAse G/E